ncbi:MAG TPA: EAL domain-containing protein [Acidimicrobiales bacterium]|nr:EAL domain-containing protein [Acidimicrobiales bacterium]
MESLHLTGPPPAVRRLTALAASLAVPHEVESGVLRVPIDAAGPLIDAAESVLAPMEAALVRAVRVDLSSGRPVTILALASASPTIANLAARRRHRRLLQMINSREGATCGFQPVVELSSGRIAGFEALLRVRMGTTDVTPADVLSAAEECGRLVEVDAVARSIAIRESAPALGDRLLFVNLLPASLPVPEEQLAPFVAEVAELGLAPAQIVMEAPVGPAGMLRRQVESVFAATRASGFRVGLDNVRSDRDLGALDVVPDFVKLDRSMVRSLASSAGTRAVGNVVRECGFSGATLVAQGIESAEQQAAVHDLGIAYAQGWHLGRPGPITAAVANGTA